MHGHTSGYAVCGYDAGGRMIASERYVSPEGWLMTALEIAKRCAMVEVMAHTANGDWVLHQTLTGELPPVACVDCGKPAEIGELCEWCVDARREADAEMREALQVAADPVQRAAHEALWSKDPEFYDLEGCGLPWDECMCAHGPLASMAAWTDTPETATVGTVCGACDAEWVSVGAPLCCPLCGDGSKLLVGALLDERKRQDTLDELARRSGAYTASEWAARQVERAQDSAVVVVEHTHTSARKLYDILGGELHECACGERFPIASPVPSLTLPTPEEWGSCYAGVCPVCSHETETVERWQCGHANHEIAEGLQARYKAWYGFDRPCIETDKPATVARVSTTHAREFVLLVSFNHAIMDRIRSRRSSTAYKPLERKLIASMDQRYA